MSEFYIDIVYSLEILGYITILYLVYCVVTIKNLDPVSDIVMFFSNIFSTLNIVIFKNYFPDKNIIVNIFYLIFWLYMLFVYIRNIISLRKEMEKIEQQCVDCENCELKNGCDLYLEKKEIEDEDDEDIETILEKDENK